MKICRICHKEIINSKKRVYCSEECQSTGIKLANKISKEIEKQKYIKSKEKWDHEIIETDKEYQQIKGSELAIDTKKVLMLN